MEENVVFARVGWMQSYQSTKTGEPGPSGGGRYNLKHLGGEKDNFLVHANGRAYGYFAIGSGTQAINLFRVNGKPQPGATQKLSGIRVVFVAPHPIRKDLNGPVVVGWYRNATLYREEQESTSGSHTFRVEASFADVYCIQSAERHTSIPRARPGLAGIGQSNIYYTRESDGKKREFTWIERVLESIAEFESDSNVKPDMSAEIQAERKAGFQSDPRIRKAVEHRAMQVVRMYFSQFSLKNTSKTHSYDYSYVDGQTERYIEVKGSQQAYPAIILTRNEVAFARQHSPSMELCVVHSIIVKDGPEPIATGGVLEHYPQWNPDLHELAAINFDCKLDRTLAKQIGD